MTMMQLEDDQKIQVLHIQLQERYAAAHKMRERSTQFTIWLSGMAVGLAWLLISHNALVFSQRLALTLLIATLFIGAGIFILGLRKGFQSNRIAMIKCERTLGMYETGIYLQEDSLLPAEYEKTKGKWNDHFSTLCVWLCFVVLSLLILVWTCPEKRGSNDNSEKKIEQIMGGNKDG